MKQVPQQAEHRLKDHKLVKLHVYVSAAHHKACQFDGHFMQCADSFKPLP